MKAINRLENAWSPQWDLGMQEEFGFVAPEADETPAEPTPVAGGWCSASAQVLNRRSSLNRRLASEPNSVGSLIAYFESLFDVGE